MYRSRTRAGAGTSMMSTTRMQFQFSARLDSVRLSRVYPRTREAQLACGYQLTDTVPVLRAPRTIVRGEHRTRCKAGPTARIRHGERDAHCGNRPPAPEPARCPSHRHGVAGDRPIVRREPRGRPWRSRLVGHRGSTTVAGNASRRVSFSASSSRLDTLGVRNSSTNRCPRTRD